MYRCSKCGEKYYQELYQTTTLIYSPSVHCENKENKQKDSNICTKTCRCLNCGNVFVITERNN